MKRIISRTIHTLHCEGCGLTFNVAFVEEGGVVYPVPDDVTDVTMVPMQKTGKPGSNRRAGYIFAGVLVLLAAMTAVFANGYFDVFPINKPISTGEPIAGEIEPSLPETPSSNGFGDYGPY